MMKQNIYILIVYMFKCIPFGGKKSLNDPPNIYVHTTT